MEQPDGSIIINLQLQQDEFERRLKELEGKTSDFGNKVKTGLKIAAVATAAAFGAVLKQAIENYAQYEQLVGGVETLFKKSSDKVIGYANEAYKTAGMSANKYMETVTSFSASLLQSLGGDTKKAAEAGNQAVIDMSDNANKMGTSMEMIENAYQGFAKQNYTMLDNLKLGYGGTKEEMVRLLEEAQKLSGVEYDISNLNDVYSAIHVIQTELGITGTTAIEASTTIEGSANSMKAAWENFLTGMADENQNFDKLVENLVNSVVTFVENIGPRIISTIPTLASGVAQLLTSLGQMIIEAGPDMIQKGLELMTKLSEGFVQGFPNLMENFLTMLQDIANWLAEQAPTFIEKGFEMLSNLVEGIINAIPIMIERIPTIITTFANIINDNFPTILAKGAELLWQLITGIIGAIPTLIANIPKIIEAIVASIMDFEWLNLGKGIMDFFGKGISSMKEWIKTRGKEIFDNVISWLSSLPSKLWNLAKEAISNFGKSISNAKGTVGGAIKAVFNAVVDGLKSLPGKLAQFGSDAIKGFWNGINGVKDWIMDKIGGFFGGIVDGIKDFFGIHSPSTLMRDAIGKFLPSGIAIGFELAVPKSTKDIKNSLGNMTDDIKRKVDMSMNDINTSASLESNAKLSVNKEIVNSFPKSMKMEGQQNVYLVSEDGTELAHWIVPYIDKELKFG